ncbi:MAG: hypothetical protein WBD74_09470 [Candidatus Aquilonibacter sp.]
MFSFSVLIGAGVFAACGGGGGGSPGAPGAIIPPASPTPCPAGYQGPPPNCTQVSSLPGQFTPKAVPSATALPAFAGYGGTIFIPAANPASPVQMTLGSGNLSGVTFSLAKRATAARVADSGTNTALLYITLVPSPGPVTFTGHPGFPGFQITLPANGSAGDGPFYLAQLQSGVWTTVAGPATSSGGAVTLQPNLPILSLPPTAYFVLYTGGVVPSTAPTGSPGGQPTSSASTGPTPTSSGNPTNSSSPGSTPTPVSSGPTASPRPSPSTSATIPPTTTPSATASPTAQPTAAPTATPTPISGSQSVPETLGISGLPSNAPAGTPISFAQAIFTLSVLNSSSTQITGTFANPVTVTSSDATGAVTLSVNGGTVARSVQVGAGSQLIGIVYTGAAVNPATITASASTVTTNATASFAPAIQPIAYAPPSNLPSTCSSICLYAPQGQGAGSTYSFTATQAGYTESPYNKSLSLSGQSGCSSFATVTQTGTTFNVNAIASPSPGSCTIVIGGFGTTTLSVTITYSTFGVTLQ